MRHSVLSACVALTLFIACERSSPETDAAATDSAAASATPAASDTTAPAQGGMQAGAKFDALQLKKGDKVGGLEVKSNKTQAAPQSRLGVVGTVAFEGNVELHGSYRAHFDYPDVKEACFWVDPNDWVKLPRMNGDDRIKWFCFENKDDAIRELGALGTETRATIVIDDYTTSLHESDVWDSARLVRVVRKGS